MQAPSGPKHCSQEQYLAKKSFQKSISKYFNIFQNRTPQLSTIPGVPSACLLNNVIFCLIQIKNMAIFAFRFSFSAKTLSVELHAVPHCNVCALIFWHFLSGRKIIFCKLHLLSESLVAFWPVIVRICNQ